MSKKPSPATPPPQTFKANPFAGLHLNLPPAPAQPAAPKTPAPAASPHAPLSKADQALLAAMGGDAEIGVGSAARKPKLAFQVERKGRGGKTVTIVRGLGRLGTEEQMDLCNDLKKALGVEGLAQAAGDRRTQSHHVARLGAHDQVGVALPHPRFF